MARARTTQLEVQIKHYTDDDHHLQDRDHALFDPINQHTLDRVHVFNHARHQVASGAIVEPAQWQQLNVRIEIAAQIEDHPLLKRVVQHDAQRVKSVLDRKSVV